MASEFPDMDFLEIAAGVRRFVADMFLNNLMSVHQSFLLEVWTLMRSFTYFGSIFLVDKRMLVTGGRFPVRRYGPRKRSIVRSCMEAYQPVLWTGLAVTFAFAVLGLRIDTLNITATNTMPQLTLALLVYFAAIPASALMHELGHWYAAGAVGASRTGVSARRGVAAVRFAENDPMRAAVITVAGPLAGCLVPVIVVGCYLALGPDDRVRLGLDQLALSIVVAFGAIVLMQLLSFTPLTADGRRLWQSLRRIRGHDEA